MDRLKSVDVSKGKAVVVHSSFFRYLLNACNLLCVGATLTVALLLSANAFAGDAAWSYRLDKWGNATGVWISAVKNGKPDANGNILSDIPNGIVTIPSQIDGIPVKGIDADAFSGCTNITSVIMPDSIVCMAQWGAPFSRCYKLSYVDFSSNLTNISDSAFSLCTNFWAGAQSVSIPSGIRCVGSGNFGLCLTNITIPASLERFRGRFQGYTNLVSITISSLSAWCKIKLDDYQVGNFANPPKLFMGGKQLTDVVIPSGAKSIADFSVFSWCSGIRSVVIPDSVTYIGKYAFYSPEEIVGQFSYQSNSELESVIIGNGVEEIGEAAFYGCMKLTNVVMGAGVRKIGSNCFQYGHFRNFSLGENVERVGDNVFDGCQELETIIFPSTITNIGSMIVSECFKLSAIYLPTNYEGNVSRSFGSHASKIIRYVPEQTLVFDLCGGNMEQTTKIVKFNSAYGILPEPVRDGYVFDGWFYNGERITAQSIVRAINDHELTAAWKPIKYAVAFDANGGAGEMGGIEVEYDSVTNLPLNVFRCPKMVFAGWSTNATGEVLYTDGASISNVCTEVGAVQTLFAVWSPLVVATPVMTPGDGFVFRSDSCQVVLSCATEGAAIYCSTNGTTPRTSAANVYNGPFAVSGAVTVIAVAVCDGVKSEYMTASLVKGAPLVPVIAPSDGHLFVEDSCEVTITCPTATATIYYTVDGSMPQKSESCRYTGPFHVSKTTTIRAFAANDTFESECVSATITKWTLTLADAVGAPALVFSTGGESGWAPIADETATSGYSAKSGEIGDAEPGAESVTWIETSVSGAGLFSFQWKVSCEHDDFGDCTWDRLMVFTNGVEVARIDGDSGWRTVALRFEDAGTHAIRWAFVKDDFNEEQFPDIAWVSGVIWTPDSGIDVDPIPEISVDSDIATALAGFSDEMRLGAHITTKAQYDLFRAWVDANGLEHQAVKDSPRAWFSYAIRANQIVENTFRNDDMIICSLETTSTGTFSFEVDIKDVAISAAAAPENLATVFRVQGAASLSEGAFSSNNLNVELGVSQNGRLAVTVTPKHANKKFFIRVKMYPDSDAADEIEIEHGKVQLWENGPYWATTNIGAEKPWEYGFYFWWGDVVGYKYDGGVWVSSDGTLSNISFDSSNTPTHGKSIATLQNEGWITADGVLAPEHDVSQVHWGDGWRMPTYQELKDINSKCDWAWTTTNGVSGYIVRGRGDYASASIFLPAAGYGDGTSLYHAGAYGDYWSSVSDSDGNTCRLFFRSDYINASKSLRYYGFPVRPVQGFNE